jgi:hypothetical protein
MLWISNAVNGNHIIELEIEYSKRIILVI